MRPKISVIVPIYNAELYLEQCIESVLNQTLRDIELLLIDDGSTDNTEEVVQDLLKDTEAGFKIEYVKKEIHKKFDKNIELEVQVIGEK